LISFLRIANANSLENDAGHHSVPQPSTNAVLVDMAKRHECVVRLKGGDPFLFGRGGEEAAYLAARNIPVEVVPGVTAGIAAPAYAGIPVTHRRSGSSVTVCHRP
jgi:uroporphyrin-III C-methyltransferase